MACMFRIATFAHLSGLSAKVLRDYDAAGVFRPAWVDADTGYRMYSPAQLPELRRILALRDLGVGLEEIRALVDRRADLCEVLDRRRATLEAARAELDRRIMGVGISLASIKAGDGRSTDSAGSEVDIVVREVPSELVATLDVAATGGDVGRAFYELERRIRDAGVRAPRPPGELLGAPEGPAVEVFVPVRRAAAGLDTRRVPAIRAATALHHGSYRTIDRTRRALERWISGAGLHAGFPSRIVYLQFGAESELRVPPAFVVADDEALVTELQVPV
jgi:DNA-binding transcriptional MerR regulator